MPGKWQVKILHALATASPLSVGALRGRWEARTLYERTALTRALGTLVAHGLIARRGRGRYARVEDVAARLRARFLHTALGRDTGGREATHDPRPAGPPRAASTPE